MPLDTEIGLSPGHIVLDGNPDAPRTGAQESPLFGPCLLWPNVAYLSNCLASVFSFDVLKHWTL